MDNWPRREQESMKFEGCAIQFVCRGLQLKRCSVPGDLWQNWTAGRDVFDKLLLDSDWAVNNGSLVTTQSP